MCMRCNRLLLRAPVMVAGMSLGPKCAQAVAGHRLSKPRRRAVPRVSIDARQPDLFQEAQA